MEYFGSEIKKLRCLMHLNQKDVYANITSRSTFHRIESNDHVPTLDIAKKILNRLDVSQEELAFRLNDFDIPTKNKLINEFRNIGSSANTKGIDLLIKKIDKYLKNNTSQSIFFIKLILLALKTFQTEQSFENARELVKPIWNELSKKDEWLYKDILIISNILYLFDEVTFQHMKKRLIFFIKKNHKLLDTHKLYLITCLNSALYFKNNGKLTEAKDDIEKALLLAQEQKDFIRYADALYFKAEYLWQTNQKEEAKILAKKSFVQLFSLDALEVLEDNQQDWEKLTNINTDLFIQELQKIIET